VSVGTPDLTRIKVQRDTPRPSRGQGSSQLGRRSGRVDQQDDRRSSGGIPIRVRHTSWHPRRCAGCERNGLLSLGQRERAGQDVAALGVFWVGMRRCARIEGWQRAATRAKAPAVSSSVSRTLDAICASDWLFIDASGVFMAVPFLSTGSCCAYQTTHAWPGEAASVTAAVTGGGTERCTGIGGAR